MWEIAGDVLEFAADAGLRSVRVRRIERRLAAGQPVRIPCGLRRAGVQPETFVDGGLRVVGAGAECGSAAFVTRSGGARELARGGIFGTPDTSQAEYPTIPYAAPGGGAVVVFQVHHRYLPLLERALVA
ncbi:hypothetical protein CFP65_2806 [Kitasatospora sp. MMS16-BH015]|uniref:hypothetical protein n=1 Tax=Kitasatospora sp. MMS16-BH015 TaxID=2018025 RepID=UPI000CA26140|nr:hypothetical protein [Kitasatospora sp. MMS16-BH015]AUG77623.1 hypothetical protein CFP65_2806 [Kitasatospora sp. MMS16-BH015]